MPKKKTHLVLRKMLRWEESQLMLTYLLHFSIFFLFVLLKFIFVGFFSCQKVWLLLMQRKKYEPLFFFIPEFTRKEGQQLYFINFLKYNFFFYFKIISHRKYYVASESEWKWLSVSIKALQSLEKKIWLFKSFFCKKNKKILYWN